MVYTVEGRKDGKVFGAYDTYDEAFSHLSTILYHGGDTTYFHVVSYVA